MGVGSYYAHQHDEQWKTMDQQTQPDSMLARLVHDDLYLLLRQKQGWVKKDDTWMVGGMYLRLPCVKCSISYELWMMVDQQNNSAMDNTLWADEQLGGNVDWVANQRQVLESETT